MFGKHSIWGILLNIREHVWQSVNEKTELNFLKNYIETWHITLVSGVQHNDAIYVYIAKWSPE